jgi:AcrR family transcriptional regulator
MGAEVGLRERKKQQTRQTIAEAAQQLFVERGFDAVTVAEVARAADVSEGTVFNYFPSKEDLFYSGMETFEAELFEAVRRRPPGEAVSTAFRRFMLEQSVRLAEPERADLIATAARIVGASPALQARERELIAQSTDELARLIAEETGARADDVEPATVAHALIGVQEALRRYVWASVVAGRHGRELAADVKAQGKRAFARLERGLSDYAVKRKPRP